MDIDRHTHQMMNGSCVATITACLAACLLVVSITLSRAFHIVAINSLYVGTTWRKGGGGGLRYGISRSHGHLPETHGVQHGLLA